VLTGIGAEIHILPFVRGFSTTQLIERIRKAVPKHEEASV
jgi:bifunctional ADP-heptose synthase (sugar kinase/adenylyltransferase)